MNAANLRRRLQRISPQRLTEGSLFVPGNSDSGYWPSIQTSPSSKNSFFQMGTTFFNLSIA